MVKWKEKAVHQFYTGVLTQTNNRYRAAGKNKTFMFFVAVIHSEQHTIYVAMHHRQKGAIGVTLFRTYRNNLIENLEGYRGIEECLGCSAC